MERPQLLSRPELESPHSRFKTMYPGMRSLSISTCIMDLMRLSLQRAGKLWGLKRNHEHENGLKTENEMLYY